MCGPARKSYHYLCEECRIDVKVYSVPTDYLCAECRSKNNQTATDWNKVAEEIV